MTDAMPETLKLDSGTWECWVSSITNRREIDFDANASYYEASSPTQSDVTRLAEWLPRAIAWRDGKPDRRDSQPIRDILAACDDAELAIWASVIGGYRLVGAEFPVVDRTKENPLSPSRTLKVDRTTVTLTLHAR